MGREHGQKKRGGGGREVGETGEEEVEDEEEEEEDGDANDVAQCLTVSWFCFFWGGRLSLVTSLPVAFFGRPVILSSTRRRQWKRRVCHELRHKGAYCGIISNFLRLTFQKIGDVFQRLPVLARVCLTQRPGTRSR